MRTASLVLFFLMTSGTFAHADAIDGDWCNEDGSHLRIEGPKITLGSGKIVEGKYSRHEFSYIAPPCDWEAGVEVQFRLSSEDLMRRLRNPDAMPEHADLWRRCQTTS